jgi:hypothetical protein
MVISLNKKGRNCPDLHGDVKNLFNKQANNNFFENIAMLTYRNCNGKVNYGKEYVSQCRGKGA